MCQRGELIERSFAHMYETGGMRRTHLRGHTNILKRLLIHAAGFNLSLLMRHAFGIGKPRALQSASEELRNALLALLHVCIRVWQWWTTSCRAESRFNRLELLVARQERLTPTPAGMTRFSTGC